jgi:hypothetical protein
MDVDIYTVWFVIPPDGAEESMFKPGKKQLKV